MTEVTPLGWPVQNPTSPELYRWVIPGANRHYTLLRGVPGFVAAVYITWYDRNVERLDIPNVNDPVDEGGYNKRKNVNDPDVWSEHSGGTAWDSNWNRHPNGVPASKTFTTRQVTRIRNKIRLWNTTAGAPVLRWGGDYRHTSDAMHTEEFHNTGALRRLARVLKVTPMGREVVKANPSQARFL